MGKILDKVNSPEDLKLLSQREMEQLAAEIREILVDTVSANGGHLASNLGVVELTLALHRVFQSPKDKIVWDVGHQAYTHKLLTGRKKSFATLRQYGGLSGFTSRVESEHDPFGAGHASTSISAALGMAIARDLAGDDYQVIAVIGDGAVTGGMALEALNQAGHLGSKLIVILNDNGMSISPTVGALARLLSKVRFHQGYRKTKEKSWSILSHFPFHGLLRFINERFERGVKSLVMQTTLWEELGFTYLGPIKGHSIPDLEKALSRARDYPNKPTLVHVVTTKGKGHLPAEDDAVYFHGVSASKGAPRKAPTYSQIFARTMQKLARENPLLTVITPAMPEGNCLNEVQQEFPRRVFDVGICEQHSVTFAAGLATQGFIPVIAIYSTFLQRAFDQIIHDVCLQDLPMVFAIDRGGIVGDDGKTHQGAFDISYLTMIPNLVVAAPKDENELQHLLFTAVNSKHPMAVRYPRGSGLGVKLDDKFHNLPVGKGEVLREGADVAILALGSTVKPSLDAAAKLASEGINATVVNARFAKPLDTELIADLAGRIDHIITVEENVISGGFGSAVSNFLHQAGFNDVKIRNVGLPDDFIEHGSQAILRRKFGLDADGIAENVRTLLAALEPDSLLKAD